jgi:hypothetical protein
LKAKSAKTFNGNAEQAKFIRNYRLKNERKAFLGIGPFTIH